MERMMIIQWMDRVGVTKASPIGYGISGLNRPLDHPWSPSTLKIEKCRKCYLIIIHGIKWNLEIEKPPNESSYHIISLIYIPHHSKTTSSKSAQHITHHHSSPNLPVPPTVHGVRSRGTGAFDGHATLLFIRPGVGEARISRRLGADDASLADPGENHCALAEILAETWKIRKKWNERWKETKNLG